MLSAMIGAYVLVLVAVLYAVAAFRKGKVDSIGFSSRVLEFDVASDRTEVFMAISRGVDGFRKEDADAERGLILLTTGPSFATWGFFFPIILEELPEGGTRIRISISSRIFQVGPLVTKWHKKCLAAVESSVGTLPLARIAG